MDRFHHKAQQPDFSSTKSDSLPDFCKTPRRLTDNTFLLKCSVTWFFLHHSLQLIQQRLLHSNLNQMVLVQKRYIALTPKHKIRIPKRFSYERLRPSLSKTGYSYSAAWTASFTLSISVVGSKRAITLPSRSIRNLVKFHWI